MTIVHLQFKRTSPDGEQGFPGNAEITVTYTLNDKNDLRLEYKVTSDKATPVNFTNHAYFNLHGSGTVLNHTLQMNSEYTLDVDEKLIPTGKLNPVKGTAFDFNTAKTLGKDIEEVMPGYDNCYTTCWSNLLRQERVHQDYLILFSRMDRWRTVKIQH